MADALNYTIHALSDLATLRDKPAVGPEDRTGIDFITSLLRRAQVFVLPERGELLDRGKNRPQVSGLTYTPPFPVVALEYRSSDREGCRRDPIYEATDCSRRISLAWEWDGVMPNGAPSDGGPEVGSGVCIASIVYIDNLRMWAPFAGAFLVPYDCIYREPEKLQEHTLALLKSRRISEKQAMRSAIEIGGILPLMPNWLQSTIQSFGHDRALGMLQTDLMDEVNAYLDLCVALACRNVEASHRAQPPKLNKSRIKKGQLPYRDFHVLTIGGEEYGGGEASGQGTGVRSHLRRGHIRRLSPERITWVNATIVKGRRDGFVEKAYALDRETA